MKTAIPESGGAKSGAPGALSGEIDPELAAVIAAWETLPVAVRRGILAMVEAATK